MGRSKKNKGGSKKEGDKYRKETKEERRERLRLQEEAREQCFKLLPYAGGVVMVFFLMFGVWVRSVPPALATINLVNPLDQMGGSPEFMNVNTEPMLQEALKEAKEALDAAKENGVPISGEKEEETAETIEL